MKPWIRLLLGWVVGNLAGALLWGFGVWVLESNSPLPVLGFPSLLFVPTLTGFAASWVWAPLDLPRWKVLLHSLGCTVLLLSGAWFFMGEGAVCLVMAAPLLYLAVAAGALLGRELFRTRNTPLLVTAGPLIALVTVVEPMLLPKSHGVVTDEVRIAAPPSAVWPHVLRFDAISAPPDYWLFRMGLPYPVSTTNQGDQVGASRACQFSGGATFEETISEFEPGRRLTFEIVKSPPDPELLGHLEAHRGQFELVDNRDGTTTLIGRTWYTLHMRPGWYFNAWTHAVFRAVHLRVMHHVQALAEAAGKASAVNSAVHPAP